VARALRAIDPPSSVNTLLIIALSVLGIAVVSFLISRKSLRRLVRARAQPCQLDTSSSRQSQLEQLDRLPRSPITSVSFHDALHTLALTTAVDQYYRSAIATVMSGDGLNATIQSIAFSGEKLKLAYSFSDKAMHLYDSGQATIPVHRASGRRLPWMIDRHGIIIEQAKEANVAAFRIAQATALIVSAAHIISGLDVVRRLEAVDRKLSTLLAGRKSDQDAKLMRIYVEARDLLASPLTRSSVGRLEQLRYELFELRQIWRGEIEHVLNSASHPHEWQLTKPSSWARGGREKKSINDLCDVADKVQRLRLALLAEASLAESSGTMQAFLGNTVPEEYQFWTDPRNGMRNRSDTFQKETTQKQALALCEGIDGYVAILEAVCGNGK
jgi:hypothetical protein